MIGATIALDRGSDGAAGVLLGMTLFKFQYAIPIALLFFGWRRWRFLAGFAIAGAMVTGLSVSLVGFSGAASYLHSVTAMSAKFSAAEGIRYGIHPEQMANLRGLAFVVSRGSARLTQVLTIALSTIVMIWAAFKRSSLPGALLAALLVSYHQTISDTALLVFPLALILSGYLAAPDAQRERSAALAAILFFGPAFLLLLAGNRLYLLTIPMLGLLAFWDGTYPSPFRDQRAVPAGNESIADRGT